MPTATALHSRFVEISRARENEVSLRRAKEATRQSCLEKCSKQRQSVIRVLVAQISIISSPLCLFVTTSTKTVVHYAKERPIVPIKVSSESPHIAAGFPWHSLDRRREYFLLIADVKAKSFKPSGSFKRSLYCLISAGFHSSHARLFSRIEIECLGYFPVFATPTLRMRARRHRRSHEIYL